ncbi:MAG: hypothetical protein JST38_05040, partial [Bacteroidetes bacterium]|nr:hypothetical protein [Bacteroidota bacterium]
GYGDIGVDGSQFEQNHNLINSDNNYKYDKLGNLIQDKREEIANIEWTVSGKVKRITRTADSTKPPLEFAYGADGQRISKTVGDPLNGGYKEYYLRDAQGNVMAMYRHHLIPVPNTDPQEYEASLKVVERPIYGSRRIGSYTGQKELAVTQTITNYPYTQSMQAPLKRYELTDHLGNVATVVTGRLLDGAGAGSAKQAEVVSAQGYEAFGSLLPGRNYSSSNYRWGFQGQIKDDEIFGATGTSYAFEYRMHDPRAGRFWSIDPLAAKYPHNSPYAFSENRVIDKVELEGLETKDPPLWACPALTTPQEKTLQQKWDEFKVADLIPKHLIAWSLPGGKQYARENWTARDWTQFGFEAVSTAALFLPAGEAAAFTRTARIAGEVDPLIAMQSRFAVADATTTTAFRVESAANARLSISATGDVAVQGENMLFLNFGQEARAASFLERRLGQGYEGSQIKSFEVRSSFLDQLRSGSVLESEASQFPQAPLRVDVKTPDQFGLRPAQIQELKSNIVQGSGKTN